MNKQKTIFNPYANPIWIKYRCEHGAQWTSVKGGGEEHDMSEDCGFSGCKPGHKVEIVGETSDRDEAYNWFNNPYRQESF